MRLLTVPLFLGLLLAAACTAATPAQPTPQPTPDASIRRVNARAQWLSESGLRWLATGAGSFDPRSDGGYLASGSRVQLVPGAAQGSHRSFSANGLPTYAEVTLVTAASGSETPPNPGVHFWIKEADLD